MPTKINKWIYGWKLYLDYGGGWEFETFSCRGKETKMDMKAYRENCPYPQKWVKAKELNPEWMKLNKMDAARQSTVNDGEEVQRLRRFFFRKKDSLNLYKTPLLKQSPMDKNFFYLNIVVPAKHKDGKTVYFRDPDGNQILKASGYLWFESSVNPNGINSEGDFGRTFTLHFKVKGTVKRFRCRSWDEVDVANVYVYGTTPENTWNRFEEKITQSFPDWLETLILESESRKGGCSC